MSTDTNNDPATSGTPPPDYSQIRGITAVEEPVVNYTLPEGAEHINDAHRQWWGTCEEGARWRFVVPAQRARELEEQVAVLTPCRDHWKISFDHERANVIRLRNLIYNFHAGVKGLGGCKCEDCQLVRQHSKEELPDLGPGVNVVRVDAEHVAVFTDEAAKLRGYSTPPRRSGTEHHL